MTIAEQPVSAVEVAKEAASAAATTHLWNPGHVLTVVALVGVICTVIIAAIVLLRLPDGKDIETRKIRFAAATFTGILILFVFAAILYFADDNGLNAGKEIFEKAITAMTPLAGVIIGYLFGTKQQSVTGSPPPPDKPAPVA